MCSSGYIKRQRPHGVAPRRAISSVKQKRNALERELLDGLVERSGGLDEQLLVERAVVETHLFEVVEHRVPLEVGERVELLDALAQVDGALRR